MYTLKTLGTLRIERAGQEVDALPAQPLRCAVFVYTAVAEKATRDRLATMFWGNTDERKAKHALSQTLYELRRSLGDDWVDAGGTEIRITADVHVDVHEFERLVEAGETEAALALYEGRFLDGVHLADSTEFQRWVDQERIRLERLHRGARRTVVDRLAAAGRTTEAAAQARAWIEIDPLDDEGQHRLIELLLESGDRPGALRQYELYEQALALDDLEPLEDTQVLIASVRSGAWQAPDRGSGPTARLAPPAPTPGQGGDASTPISGRSRRGRRVAVWLAAAATLLAAGVAVARWSPFGANATPAVRTASLRVTAPTADRQREIEETLAVALRLIPGVRMAEGDAADADFAVEASVSTREGRARVAADLVRVPGGEPPPPVVREGSDEELAALIDEVALEVVRHVALAAPVPAGRLRQAAWSTRSVNALSHAATGDRLYDAGEIAAAARAYEEAVAADPDFAIAYFRWSMLETAGVRDNAELALRIIERGLARSAGWDARQIGLLRAQRAYVLREPERAISGFQRLAVDNEEMVDAWLGLGESLFHLGPWLGQPGSAAIDPFRQVLRLDREYGDASYHLATLATEADQQALARSLLDRFPAGERKAELEATFALRFGPDDVRARMLDSLKAGPRSRISTAITQLAVDPVYWRLADSAASFLGNAGRTPSDRTRGGQYHLLLRAALGDPHAGLAAWSDLSRGAELDAWLLHVFLAGAPVERFAEPMLERARRFVDAAPEVSLDYIPADPLASTAWRAVLHAAVLGGSAAEVRALKGRLESVAVERTDPYPDAFRHALDARAALLDADTAGAIEALERALTRIPQIASTFSPLSDFSPERDLLATLYQLTGDARRADRWRRSFVHSRFLPDIVYRTPDRR